jgi:hypothetical protein
MAGKGRNETRKRKIKRKTEEGRGKLIRKWGREELLPVKKSIFTHTQTDTLVYYFRAWMFKHHFFASFLSNSGPQPEKEQSPFKGTQD